MADFLAIEENLRQLKKCAKYLNDATDRIEEKIKCTKDKTVKNNAVEIINYIVEACEKTSDQILSIHVTLKNIEIVEDKPEHVKPVVNEKVPNRIRLVSIDKLIDPTIKMMDKRSSPAASSTTSVTRSRTAGAVPIDKIIVIESDEEDEPLSAVKSSNQQNKTKKFYPLKAKENITNNVNAATNNSKDKSHCNNSTKSLQTIDSIICTSRDSSKNNNNNNNNSTLENSLGLRDTFINLKRSKLIEKLLVNGQTRINLRTTKCDFIIPGKKDNVSDTTTEELRKRGRKHGRDQNSTSEEDFSEIVKKRHISTSRGRRVTLKNLTLAESSSDDDISSTYSAYSHSQRSSSSRRKKTSRKNHRESSSRGRKPQRTEALRNSRATSKNLSEDMGTDDDNSSRNRKGTNVNEVRTTDESKKKNEAKDQVVSSQSDDEDRASENGNSNADSVKSMSQSNQKIKRKHEQHQDEESKKNNNDSKRKDVNLSTERNSKSKHRSQRPGPKSSKKILKDIDENSSSSETIAVYKEHIDENENGDNSNDRIIANHSENQAVSSTEKEVPVLPEISTNVQTDTEKSPMSNVEEPERESVTSKNAPKEAPASEAQELEASTPTKEKEVQEEIEAKDDNDGKEESQKSNGDKNLRNEISESVESSVVEEKETEENSTIGKETSSKSPEPLSEKPGKKDKNNLTVREKSSEEKTVKNHNNESTDSEEDKPVSESVKESEKKRSSADNVETSSKSKHRRKSTSEMEEDDRKGNKSQENNSDETDSEKEERIKKTKKKLAKKKKDSGSEWEAAIESNGNESDVDDADDDDDDFGKKKKKRVSTKRKKRQAISESDSDKSESMKKTTKRKKESESESEKENDQEEVNKKPTKRKRIKIASESGSSGSDKDSPSKKRKNIRKLIKEKHLNKDTKTAAKEEEERKRRIEERQKLYNEIYEEPESTELKKLVLDFDEETKDELLKVDDGLLKQLKPHQATGVKFMWDACFETLKDIDTKPGSGCILAHCMGLGKTLQVITLTHTLLTNSDKTHIEKVLIITPLSTLSNWKREFHSWMRYCKKKDIEVYDMSAWRENNIRVHKLNEWHEEGGVCIIGYDMYRILANPTASRIRKKMRESLQKSLVDPGPDLVICDEGHLLKNEKTSLSKAVSNMRTQRRIVLTGTPLQNNLKEYYCMIQFVKPNLLGTYKEYMNRFVNPITNGQYTDSTERDIRLMKNRSHVLHKLLEGCIQRKDYSVLAPYLPPKHEYVIFITLTEIQKKMYLHYIETQKPAMSELTSKGAVLFQDFQNLRRIWTHPLTLKVNSEQVMKRKVAKGGLSDSEGSLKDFVVESDTTESDTTETDKDSISSGSHGSSSKSNNKGKSGGRRTNNVRRTRQNADTFNDDDDVTIINEAEKEWWQSICSEDEINNLLHSNKISLLMSILQETESIGDKILLFSQSLQSLDVIEHFLALVDAKTSGEDIEGNVGDYSGSWIPGTDYFRLDGSCSVEAREQMCKVFNDPKNTRARLFLISTRAGGLGINLVAANRVIIFDVSWNPSHDTQSIFRVYRFGQIKPCYIYRFIALGTMEEKIYERQVAKQATAKRVIDEQQIGRQYSQNDLLELYKFDLNQEDVQRPVPALPKDRLFADMLVKSADAIFKYHEHDSLLENEESEILNEEERKAAWAEYEAEKNRPAQMMAYARQSYGPVNGPVTSNKIFGFRTDVLLRLLNMKVQRDHPLFSDGQIGTMVPILLQQLYAQMNVGDTTLYNQLVELSASLEIPQNFFMNPMSMSYTAGNSSHMVPSYAVKTHDTQGIQGQVPRQSPSEYYQID